MRYVYQVYMCMYVRMCAYSRAFTSHQCGSASVSPLLRNLVWRCLMGLAPAYCQDLCCPTTGTRDHSSLRSMERGLLFVPFSRTPTSQARAFSVVAPLCGRGFHWHSDCSPGFILTQSTLV